MTSRSFWASLVLVGALGLRAAQAGEVACTAIVGGRLLSPEGAVEQATVVIEGERIRDAGAGVAVPPGCRAIDATGRIITAGFVDAGANVGLDEIDLEGSTVDVDAHLTDPVRAAFRAADGYNPRSALIPVARLGGVTSVVLSPSGGLISGQCAWVDLAGATQSAALAAAPIAIVAQLTGTAGGALRTLRELIEEARLFAARREAWEKNQARPFSFDRLDLAALGPLVERKVPLVVDANRAADIEALVRFADEMQLRLIIRGGAEAHLVARLLAAHKIPVLVDPYTYGPGGFDQMHARRDGPAILARAGVDVIISTFSGHDARKLWQRAGNAIREGLGRDAALRAVTEAPAQAFGMTDYGRIAAGKIANVVVWSGDPFEIGGRPTAVLIRGREVPLTSRQTELLERYRQLPPTHAPR